MALNQTGYLGGTGPMFVDDTTATDGKKIILAGTLQGGVMKLMAVLPDFAQNINASGFPYTPSQCTLGPYTNNQIVGNAPTYKQPAAGANFIGYANVGSDWVVATSTTGNNNNTPTTTGNGSGNSGSGNGGSGNGGSGNGGSGNGNGGSGGDSLFKTDTATTVNQFLKDYWWAVLLVLVALLWKPLIAPALGMGPKRRRR